MIEFVDRAGSWIEYRCIDELGYRTKGDTNKRLPIVTGQVKTGQWWAG